MERYFVLDFFVCMWDNNRGYFITMNIKIYVDDDARENFFEHWSFPTAEEIVDVLDKD